MFANKYVLVLALLVVVLATVHSNVVDLYPGRGRGNNGKLKNVPKKRAGEVEFRDAERRDERFDEEIISRGRRPRGRPDRGEVRTAYRKQRSNIMKRTPSARRERVNVNTYLQYYRKNDWYNKYSKCCPRKQRHGCRSYSKRLPCFLDYATKEWCCPFWPTVYIENCNCDQCAVFKGDCVSTGNCRRRYKKKVFYAVCYRNCGWNYVRRYYKHLPSSCYCKVKPPNRC